MEVGELAEESLSKDEDDGAAAVMEGVEAARGKRERGRYISPCTRRLILLSFFLRTPRARELYIPRN